MKMNSKFEKKMEKLTPDMRTLIEETVGDFAVHFVDLLPQMAQKTHDSEKNSSYSPTVTCAYRSGGNLEIIFTPRVRLPDEAKKHRLHFDPDGQLVFGWEEPNKEPKDDDKSPEAQEARSSTEPELPMGDGEKTDPADPMPGMEPAGLNVGAEGRAPVTISKEAAATAPQSQADRLAAINAQNADVLEKWEKGEVELSDEDATRLKELTQPTA